MIIVYFIRSLLFSIYFIIISLFLSLALPFAFLGNARKITDKVGKIWTWTVLLGLKYICGIKWKIKGLKNLPKKNGFIIAGKHQSAWETYIMHQLFTPVPVFILKKQLLNIPVFGWSMRVASHISIDRKAGVRALKSMLKQGRFYLDEGYNIIIFPQGTRVPIGKTAKEYPYKPGILGIVRNLKCDVVPMALNSGKYWAKKQFLKKPGTIIMEFMKPIKYKEIKKLGKKAFMDKLEKIIEKKSNELSK